MRRCGITFVLIGLGVLSGAASAGEAPPVARWDFGAEETTPLTLHGSVQRDQAGPVPPEYPDFTENNLAVRLDGSGAYLALPDPGPNSPYDFTNGDAITLEAWINLDELQDGQPMYVIGKGRTNAPSFAKDNQNWAMRLVGVKGVARLSFLFATPPGRGEPWHRWTSEFGFKADSGWHHVAVTYRFGAPDTIQGWIDGLPTGGTWDMGGATKEAPVVDDDAIWIGAALGGNPANSFRGLLDAIAVHRTLLGDEVIASRFNRLGGPQIIGPRPEVMPEMGAFPEGQVAVTFAEGHPTHERWLNEGEAWPEETLRWTGDAFLLPRIPLRHDGWGIRTGWKAPVLLRMAADVELTPGTHEFLVRARALSRLWVDGVLVARTEPMVKEPPNGEEPMTPLAEPPLPGLRPHGYRMQEVSGEAMVAEDESGRHRVVLEVVVGGKNFRTETGEICVALRSPNGTAYTVLRPPGAPPLPLTDPDVNSALAGIHASLDALDDRNRRMAAASQDAFWKMRHDSARAWAGAHPAPAVPIVAESPAAHPIDAFVAAKIQRMLDAQSSGDAGQAEQFHTRVLPVLRDNCFRCHGEKDKGGLRLNTREALLEGGDSETPAVTPGDPAAGPLLARVRSTDEDVRMPPTGDALTPEQIADLETWIQAGAPWPASPDAAADIALPPVTADAAFLRRVFFDTVGVPPPAGDVRRFLADTDPDKRADWIDWLLGDERCADNWMGYWQDLLAENPTLLNASLNSTGPFRWFIYDALRDHKPLDRLVTELILLRGGIHEGGSAGFALAAENDAPYAAKGHIVASAFLGINMQCARCHDSPYHSATQRDLFSLAALFERKPVTAPASSSVPATFFAKLDRKPLIQVTLKPGEPVEPAWPFGDVTGAVDGPSIDALMQDPGDTRERLAALITAPENTRFAEVMVNRLWKRLMGAGFVEPAHDWEGHPPSHPELLDWLAHEFIAHDYDVTHVMRLILTSETYQREATGNNRAVPPESRFFNAPDRRRLEAEQIVDALYAATGSPMDVEELTFVHDGRRDISNRLTLDTPRRAWMFASLANERDRPSLTLPKAVAVADVLQAFGWTGARQQPITNRESEANVLQPGILANGTLSQNLIRASEGSALAQWAVDADAPESLVETLFLRVLGRSPSLEEREFFAQSLGVGFESRLLPPAEVVPAVPPEPLPLVTWFNHLQSEANTIQLEVERRVRQGPPADPRFRDPWRKVYEDMIWSLVNHREFVWLP